VGNVLRRHQGNGLARITAVREQSPGGLDFARTFEDVAILLGVKRRAGRKIAGHGFPQTIVISDPRRQIADLQPGAIAAYPSAIRDGHAMSRWLN
jgi:hypothetical protein